MKKPENKKEQSIREMFGFTSLDTEKEKAGNVETQNDNVKLVKDDFLQQENDRVNAHIYKAFSANNSAQPQLELRLKNQQGKWLYYPFITHAEYQGDESITLVYHSTTYTIKGSNLQAIKNHFRTQSIEYIQEFDAAQFEAMPAQGEPIITEIEIGEVGEEE